MNMNRKIRHEQQLLKLKTIQLTMQLIRDYETKIKSPEMVAAISGLIQSLTKL